AMRIGDRWQEGEVVERQAARRAYEDFLHRRQDPALLENKAGNQFSARVFPIPARARKELIISYSQELPNSSEPYRLLLRGLPQLENLDAKIIIREHAVAAGGPSTTLGGASSSQRVIEVNKQNYAPDQDLEVRSARAHTAVGLRHQNLAVARIAPVANLPADPIDGLTVLFDTSASRALGFARQVDRLGKVIAAVRTASQGDFPLRVVCFDQELEQVYEGPASGFGRPQLDRVFSRRPLGASDLQGALKAVYTAPPIGSRLLIFSDGIATAGSTEGGSLRESTQLLSGAGFKRVDAIVDGGIQDPELLKQLTTALVGGVQGKAGAVIDARLPVETIAHKINRATLTGVGVSVPGAEWVWPQTLDGVQPGDEVLVYADLPAGRPMHIELSGAELAAHDVPMVEVARPLLERAWVGARIAKLDAQQAELGESDRDMKEALKNQIITLSTRHRVLSDYTALLVLETEWDYQRFNIDRNALVDILTVGPDGITVIDRKAGGVDPFPTPTVDEILRPPPRPRRDNFRGGEDNGGDVFDSKDATAAAAPGDGDGAFDDEAPMEEEAEADFDAPARMAAGAAAPAAEPMPVMAKEESKAKKSESKRDADKIVPEAKPRPESTTTPTGGDGTPQAILSTVTVSGALSAGDVRPTLRRKMGQVKSCYVQGVGRNASLAGELDLEIKIAADGKVEDVTVKRSTHGDSAVDRCIVGKLKAVKFPEGSTGGSTAKVTFDLRTRADAPMRADIAPRPIVRPEPRPIVRPEPPLPPKPVIDTPPPPPQPVDTTWDPRPDANSPYTGRYLVVMQTLETDRKRALELALRWRNEQPGDVLALVALGEALEAAGDVRGAARAYGSIIDLFPSRADLRRYAGSRLERLGPDGLRRAVDTYTKAVESRPDHPSSHRLLAFALVRAGQFEQAYDAIHTGHARDYPGGRFRGVDEILREDLGLIAAAWAKAEPQRRAEIEQRLQASGAAMPTQPSLRFVLNWETDANDVDFHIRDGQGGHAWYSSKTLASGGRLFADVTNGYGPECFAIDGKPSAYPYTFQAHYYSRGPMGYGMGKLEVVRHDGKGGLTFEERPFVVMVDQAFVDLGAVE
ncbi:MAG: AgmX/PglI C-terminal domain-containing protein, partial [Myxococcales bacterium]|nr:AgmX/PglI C-terminal domain-containing protein [Myxococcales bacterium]